MSVVARRHDINVLPVELSTVDEERKPADEQPSELGMCSDATMSLDGRI